MNVLAGVLLGVILGFIVGVMWGSFRSDTGPHRKRRWK